MAHHGSARSRFAALTLAATLAVTAGLTFVAAGPAQAAGPTLTLSSTNVKDGQTVTVTGKGYVKKPTNLYIAVCKNPPSATSCDTDLSRVVQVSYDGSGSFKTKYTIHTTFSLFGPPKVDVDCAKTVCVVGSTNAADPKDHTYNATAKFTVASKSSTEPSTDSPAATPDTGASGTTTSTGKAELPKTGSSPATPFIAAAGIALTLAGGALVVANSRRRPSPLA